MQNQQSTNDRELHEQQGKQINKQEEKADFTKALKFKENAVISDKNKQLFSLNVDIDEFGKYGVGITLFFEFIKLSAIVFWIMSIIAIPVIYSNLTGNGLVGAFKSSAGSMISTTIANQPQLVLESEPTSNALYTNQQIAAIQQRNNQTITVWVEQMSVRQYYVTIPDFIYTLFFIFFIMFWKRRSSLIKRQIRQTQVMPSYYTLQVFGIPENFNDEAKVMKHFSQFGPVQEVNFVKDYRGCLVWYQRETELRQEIEQETIILKYKKQDGEGDAEKLEKLKKELDENEKKTNEAIDEKFGKISQHKDFPSLSAYVTFQNVSSRQDCLKAYNKAKGICSQQPKHLVLDEKYELEISDKIDEPSNIKWENLDMKFFEKSARICCIILAILLVMSLSFGIIFVANVSKPTSTSNCAAVKITSQQQAQNSSLTDCYCRQQSVTEIQEDSKLQSLCSSTYLTYLFENGLFIAVAFVIVIVNALLEKLLTMLAIFNKFKTVTQMSLGITSQLFIALFINTAILALLLQADIYGFTPAKLVIENILLFLKTNSATYYPDFSRIWYTSVGNKILTNFIFLTVTPHLPLLFLLPCIRCFRERKAKQQTLQSQMNELIVGEQFVITEYYATVLNVIFCCMMYASAMPILLFFAAVSLTLQYWTYKYLFLRYNKQPPTYDTSINKRVSDYLIWGVVIHLIVGIYMYGQPLIFPQSSSIANSALSSTNASLADDSTSTGAEIIKRIEYSPGSIILTCILVCILAFKLVQYSLLGQILSRLFSSMCKSQDSKISNNFGSLQEEKQNMKQLVTTYNIRDNETYVKLVQAIETTGVDEDIKVVEELQNSIRVDIKK